MLSRSLFVLPLLMVACSDSDFTTDAEPSREQLYCTAAGVPPGTPEFAQCLAAARIVEQDRADRREAHKERETIGDGLAVEICHRFARNKLPYPVEKRVTERVSGDYEKTVTISYQLRKNSGDPNYAFQYRDAVCSLRGREIVDFQVR